MAEYAKRRLGVFEQGTFKGRKYAHILLACLRSLNFLESTRAELQDYLLANPSIKLHKYFHHLNSSQAFAFNLFYPYFASGGNAAKALGAVLGIDADVLSWKFEYVQDTKEGTNVDVMWRISNTASVFCEVKLSESEFGAAEDDERHRKKLSEIYRPRIKSIISADLLEEKAFFGNYQLLRNVCLLAGNAGHQLVILLPRENELLDRPLRQLLASVDSKVRGQMRVIYIEDCLSELQKNPSFSPELRIYASKLAEKCVVPSSPCPT